MKRFSVVKSADNGLEEEEEARAKRIVTFMGLVGPLILVGLLLWTAHWDASMNAQTVRQDYFPSYYVNAATMVEDHVQAF